MIGIRWPRPSPFRVFMYVTKEPIHHSDFLHFCLRFDSIIHKFSLSSSKEKKISNEKDESVPFKNISVIVNHCPNYYVEKIIQTLLFNLSQSMSKQVKNDRRKEILEHWHDPILVFFDQIPNIASFFGMFVNICVSTPTRRHTSWSRKIRLDIKHHEGVRVNICRE